MNQIQTIMVPEQHRKFLESAIPVLQADERIIGIGIGGSFILKSMDEYSDIDLILAIDPFKFDEVMQDRKVIASRIGNLVESFSGEHVGEPRLLICLYNNPVLHVDLKFVKLDDISVRVEDPIILMDRDNRLRYELDKCRAKYPEPELQWIEERFWIWIHYAATKIGRGELFEVIEFLSFLRGTVLGPLALKESGAKPAGVRKIELYAPGRIQAMKKTIAEYNYKSCYKSVKAAISLYISLRESLGNSALIINKEAERVAIEYLCNVIKQH